MAGHSKRKHTNTEGKRRAKARAEETNAVTKKIRETRSRTLKDDPPLDTPLIAEKTIREAAKLLDETNVIYSDDMLKDAWHGGWDKPGLKELARRSADPVLQGGTEAEIGVPLMDEALPATAYVLQRHPDKVEKFVKYMAMLSHGVKTKTILEKLELTWPQLRGLGSFMPCTRAAVVAAKELGEEYRAAIRLDAAHERAVEGVEEPVFSHAGKLVGHRRVYSDRLLELLLKADAPERFANRQQVEMKGGFTVVFDKGFDRDELKREMQGVEEAEWTPVE